MNKPRVGFGSRCNMSKEKIFYKNTWELQRELHLYYRIILIIMSLCVYVCVLGHSVVSDSMTPWTVVHQAPLSVAFSRQEY